MEYSITLTFSTLYMKVQQLGQDYLITLYGGTHEHIGSTVMALPRKSLSDDGSVSSTSSVLNVLGHKDEYICRKVAEAICKNKNAVVVCTGGFHMDDITEEQIREVTHAVDSLVEQFLLKRHSSK